MIEVSPRQRPPSNRATLGTKPIIMGSSREFRSRLDPSIDADVPI